jgi:hypothetical protein
MSTGFSAGGADDAVNDPIDPRRYFRETIPAAFDRALDAQPRESDEDRAVHTDMVAVNASIRVDLLGDDAATCFLDVAEGRMSAADAPRHEPFLTVALDDASFQRLAREAGDSITALLGAVAGLGREMRLTAKRVRDLAAVDAAIRIEVEGETGFGVTLGLGEQAAVDAPDATLRMDAASYAALRAGTLDPEQAFLEDAVDTEGDLEKLFALALAAVAPD